jgi:hypothetical protein
VRHPTALVCYNRAQHLGRVLAALRRHKPDPLYVFCDGPKNEADAGKVQAVRKLVSGIDWTEPQVFTRPYNIGLAASIIGAVDHVLARHETVILLEDDCVPGPYFYEYMGACLHKYRAQQVLSASGYTVRLPDSALVDYGYDVYFVPRIGSWGWATWRDRWNLYERDTGGAQAKCKEAGIDLRLGGNDVPGLVQACIERGLDAWTPGWILTGYLYNMVSVYPTRSHVTNIGMDGSGVHSGKDGKWATPSADRPSTRFSALAWHKPIIDIFMEYYGGYTGR